VVFNNLGTFRKSGGASEFTNATIFQGGVVFNQRAGAIDVQNGTNGLELAFQGGGSSGVGAASAQEIDEKIREKFGPVWTATITV